MKYLLFLMLWPVALLAQQADNTQRVIVEVKQPSVEDSKSIPAQTNEWVEVGRNVGVAMREGLSALTDEANKFADTDAGRFTMAVIAWKVAGKDAKELTTALIDRSVKLVVGVPALITLVIIYLWIMRKSFICHRVVVEKTGPFWARSKKYEIINKNQGAGNKSEGYVFALVFANVLFVGLAVVCVALLVH